MPQTSHATSAHAPGDEPLIHLAPDDVETAQVAGVQFARALAGAPTMAFMAALGEQEHVLRQAVERAGFATPIARAAADAFTVGARLEWNRIAPATVQGAVGLA